MVLFAVFIAFIFVVFVRAILFDYFPTLIQTLCPLVARCTTSGTSAKGIPNYFDAIPTSTLREMLARATLREDLVLKYRQALDKRQATADSPLRRRKKRTISAAEHYNAEHWIVGCSSYALNDNKEYVDALALDSHLAHSIDLDQLF